MLTMRTQEDKTSKACIRKSSAPHGARGAVCRRARYSGRPSREGHTLQPSFGCLLTWRFPLSIQTWGKWAGDGVQWADSGLHLQHHKNTRPEEEHCKHKWIPGWVRARCSLWGDATNAGHLYKMHQRITCIRKWTETQASEQTCGKGNRRGPRCAQEIRSGIPPMPQIPHTAQVPWMKGRCTARNLCSPALYFTSSADGPERLIQPKCWGQLMHSPGWKMSAETSQGKFGTFCNRLKSAVSCIPGCRGLMERKMWATGPSSKNLGVFCKFFSVVEYFKDFLVKWENTEQGTRTSSYVCRMSLARKIQAEEMRGGNELRY